LILLINLSVITAEGYGQDKPATPSEQYEILRKDYDRASSSGVSLTDAERLKFVGRMYKHRYQSRRSSWSWPRNTPTIRSRWTL
jgi:hypothetical protein